MKNEIKLRKTEKTMEEEISTNERDSIEIEIPDLTSLKPFKFELKTNIDYEEEDIKDQIKQIVNNERWSAVNSVKFTYTERLCLLEGNDISEWYFKGQSF